MPCTAHRINMENKNIAWANALADLESAGNKGLIADALVVGACGVAIFSGGVGVPACQAALAHLAWRVEETRAAKEKSEIAMHAALEAVANYGKCMAKMTRNVE